MSRQLPILLLLALVLIGPIALRPRGERLTGDADALIVITPHNEAIRYEFGRAFARHYEAKTGRKVRVDFRTPGGTSEIARYIAGEYVASFENHWRNQLGQPWSGAAEKAFANARLKAEPGSVEAKARAAFLDSNVGCKLDIFWGGGAFDFQSAADAGYLVDNGLIAARPDLFSEKNIPQTLSGEPFWDAKGRWMGNVLSSFGIVCNTDALARLGIDTPPDRWADLGDPRYLHQIALANPTQSSSVNKSFEMLIQQQMREAVETSGLPEPQALAEGWARAMRLLRRIGANARYFTDASTKIALDVASGDCAAGMTIDFYGRFQSEAMRRPDGTSPVRYVRALGGSSVGVDPVGLFRGAPNEAVAREWIAFMFTDAGQKLWNWRAGLPGGPERYTLRRLPILPALYAESYRAFRADPDERPYDQAKDFVYHEKWTAPLFRVVAFGFRVMCIDPHDELQEAWAALAAANFPPQATALFDDVSQLGYAAAGTTIKDALGPDKIREVQMAKELSNHFRNQYREVTRLARAGE